MHPDRNAHPEATSDMQRLLVAYKILIDSEARQRYDAEYVKRQPNAPSTRRASEGFPNGDNTEGTQTEGPDLYSDPLLARWIRAAKRQTEIELPDFLEQFKAAGNAAASGTLRMALAYAIGFVVALTVVRGCRTHR